MLDISGELLEKGRELRMVFNGFDMPLYKEVNPYLIYPYELVKQYSPKMLAMYVSVILIDISSLNVIVETYLDTSLENEKLLRILPFMY